MRSETAKTATEALAASSFGVAFEHPDRAGFDVVPVNGRIVLRSSALSQTKRQVRALLREV